MGLLDGLPRALHGCADAFLQRMRAANPSGSGVF